MSAGRAIAASTGGVLALAVGVLAVGCGGTEELPSAPIAFVSNRSGTDEIFVMKADGSELVRVTNLDGDRFCCERPFSWSPDGSRLAFSAEYGEGHAIFVVDSNGSNLTRLTDPGFDGAPVWSPDGTRIVSSSIRDDDSISLYVVNADGSGLLRLTDDSASALFPTWSPDGNQMAYASCDLAEECNAELRVIKLDGSAPTTVGRYGGSLLDPPAWSPDGRFIAYAGCRDEDCLSDIFLIRADGSGRTRLTANPLGIDFGDFGPVWSPDGGKVAFICDTAEGTSICVVNSDGSDRTQLTSSGSWLDFDPSWPPDGEWLIFKSDRDKPEGSFLGNDLYIVGVDGSGFARLTEDPADDSSPVWAPR